MGQDINVTVDDLLKMILSLWKCLGSFCGNHNLGRDCATLLHTWKHVVPLHVQSIHQWEHTAGGVASATLRCQTQGFPQESLLPGYILSQDTVTDQTKATMLPDHKHEYQGKLLCCANGVNDWDTLFICRDVVFQWCYYALTTHFNEYITCRCKWTSIK